MLNDQQRKLIEDNFTAIKKKIKDVILGKKRAFKKATSIGSTKYIVNEAISHLPDAILEWKSERQSKPNFIDFMAYRSIWRLLDEYRLLNPTPGIVYKKRKELDRIKQYLLAKKGFYNDQDVEDELVLRGHKLTSFRNIKDISLISLNSHQNIFSPENKNKEYKDFVYQIIDTYKGINDIEWQDTKQSLLKKADVYFKSDDANIYKSLIINNLLPRAENKEFAKLQEIAAEFDVSVIGTYNKLSNSNMQSFAESIK